MFLNEQQRMHQSADTSTGLRAEEGTCAHGTVLRLRGTFIDIEEPKDSSPDIPAASWSRPRSASLPAALTEGASEELDIFDKEREYVAELSEKVSTIWGQLGSVRMVGVPWRAHQGQQQSNSQPQHQHQRHEKQHSQQNNHQKLSDQHFASAISVQQGPVDQIHELNCAVSSMLLHAKLTEIQPHYDQHHAEVGVAKDVLDDAHQVQTSTSALSNARLNQSSAEGSSEAAQRSNINPGSVGHPFLCARPCLYFVVGQCTNGKSCEYCHVHHSKRPLNLDRKQREKLHSMPATKAKALLLPIIRDKTLAFDRSTSSLLALQRLACSCGVTDIESLPMYMERSERTLGLTLRGMTLRLLLRTLQCNVIQRDIRKHPEAEMFVDSFLKELRQIA